MSLFFQITPDDDNVFVEMHNAKLNKKGKKAKILNFLGWSALSNNLLRL